jgi:uncharacterized coiled-coil protein SlyX
MSTLDFYNKALASESFGTKSFLSSVKQLMIKDLDNSNKAITTLVKETPSFYLKDNVELLISTALQEKYIEKARNYLTQAKKIIFELPGETTALTSKLEAAEKIIRERPTKDLIERIKENYTLYSNCASDQEVVLKMLNNLAYAFQGELKTLPLTQIALGTPENNFEDNIFTAYIDVIGQSFLITTSDRLLDKIRIMILCNNDVVKLANGETIDIVNFFSENTTLSFTRFFFGAPGTDLFPVTDVLFKDANIEGIISEQEMKKGLERLNSIEDVLKK